MAFHPPKPETVARNVERRKAEREASKKDLQARLRAKAEEENDPNGLWAETLAENVARNGDLR